MAKLYFRYGAMNCGKTTLLLQTAYNYEERGMKPLLFKPKVDTKGNEVAGDKLVGTGYTLQVTYRGEYHEYKRIYIYR